MFSHREQRKTSSLQCVYSQATGADTREMKPGTESLDTKNGDTATGRGGFKTGFLASQKMAKLVVL